MAKLAVARDLKSLGGKLREGSSPSIPTKDLEAIYYMYGNKTGGHRNRQ